MNRTLKLVHTCPLCWEYMCSPLHHGDPNYDCGCERGDICRNCDDNIRYDAKLLMEYPLRYRLEMIE